MPSEETTNTNFIVFVLTQPWFEPTINRTRGEHANHYTTDAVVVYVGVRDLDIDYIQMYCSF